MPKIHKADHFVQTVYRHYRNHGRVLPWRTKPSPYRVLVSECMLQQTQVDRVVPKFNFFMTTFPTVRALARAPLGDVLRAWQGLGYNRRARMLHQCAQKIVTEHRGRIPRSYDALIKLPGIGPYTAAAIMAFAYNEPIPLIETNVRTAYIHHFFKHAASVTDHDILPYVRATLDQEHPRAWYSALMDYGSYLKREVGNESRKSAAHVRQSRFRGSSREMQGAIVRALVAHAPLTAARLKDTVAQDIGRVPTMKDLQKLEREGLVCQHRGRWQLP